MTKLDQVREKVQTLYSEKNPHRADWADWLFKNHVFVVADNAKRLAEKYGADAELSAAAALLHDIADARMTRSDPEHEATSLKMARQILEEVGYSDDQIRLVVDDAIRYHSCHDGHKPESLEGLVLATADSLAHLKTDFYVYAAWAFGKDGTLEQLKAWALKKIDRDLHDKISFDDERHDAQSDYEAVKLLYSR